MPEGGAEVAKTVSENGASYRIKEHPVALAMAAAIVANLIIVRLGGAALSETELVAVALFVQAGAGVAATRFTRSKASLKGDRRADGDG